MNITELAVQDRVLVSCKPSEKEVATIKGFSENGKVVIRDACGRILSVEPYKIIKRF